MGGRILVVDDEVGLRSMLKVLLQRAGYEVSLAEGQSAAVAQMQQAEPYDVVITDLSMPDGSGMGVLAAAREVDDSTQIIMITAYATTAQAVQAMREGAYDYIQKPFKNDELLAVVDKALDKRAIVAENRVLRKRVAQGFRFGEVIGKSPAIRHVMDMVERVASAPSSVLITGESGTGKELVAKALHQRGDRAKHAFVAINCAALPEQLLESELFGHEKGAFTGASSKKEGLFRAAQGGTLFLDEVGELPLPLQVKLLRVLQERRVRPVGGHQEVEVDVRIVAATNRDVQAEVEAGAFREDLFYRLNVINLHLPPLRERPQDIPLLAEHFLHKHAALQDKRLRFSAAATHWLCGQPYKGNVRELENLVERAVTLAMGEAVELQDLAPQPSGAAAPTVLPLPLPPEGLDLDAHLARVEREVLIAALEATKGVRKEAAKLLAMSFRSIRYRLAKYGLDNEPPEEGESDEPSTS